MPEKRKDWTKVDVKTIKENWSKILLFLVIILPIIFIGYGAVRSNLSTFMTHPTPISWSGMQNAHAPDANSGVTTDTKTYGVHIENKTSEANKTGTVSDTDFSNTTDLLKLIFNWLPLLLGLCVAITTDLLKLIFNWLPLLLGLCVAIEFIGWIMDGD
jgi:hypothetical protein